MGLYDSVEVPCPKCGEEMEFQSKSGDCLCACYKLSEAPTDVLYDINRHSPYTCRCGTVFEVECEVSKVMIEVEKLTGKAVEVLNDK